jgi:hypothetical protein
VVAVPMRTATRRVPPACCARTATGQAAAAPPSSVMNSRRPTKAVICSPSRKVCEDKDSIIRPRVGRYVRLALGHFPQSCSASPPKPSQAELLLCEPVTLPPLLPKADPLVCPQPHKLSAGGWSRVILPSGLVHAKNS